MTGFWHVYVRWLRDRLVSSLVWTVGIIIIVVATAAFYPSLADVTAQSIDSSSPAMTSLLGLGQGIDPRSPLGYLWIGLYANIYPWMLMGLGVVLGSAAIAGEEDTGALEYLLSKPVNRTTVAFARYAAMVTTLLGVAAVSALSLVICLPLFDLTHASTTTVNGVTTTAPGATAADITHLQQLTPDSCAFACHQR